MTKTRGEQHTTPHVVACNEPDSVKRGSTRQLVHYKARRGSAPLKFGFPARIPVLSLMVVRHWIIAVCCLMFFTGCDQNPNMQVARQIFESELQKRKVSFSGPDAQGLYKVRVGTTDLTISTENIARDYARNSDPKIIERFVERVLASGVVPPWEQARGLLFFSAEPADHQFGDSIRWPVTDKACKVLVVTDLNEGTITWVTPDMLKNWHVSQDEAVQAASTNMNRLLEGKQPELTGALNGMSLGMVPVDSVFKAATIFAPNFKEFATKKLGWPVLVVIPCRDFIFVLAEKDKALLSRMGGVVQKEYRQSGYPITTEVLRVSDDGISAIGRFPE
jgi:hypothetical protein